MPLWIANQCTSIEGISDLPELRSEVENYHENKDGWRGPEHNLEYFPQKPNGRGDAWLGLQRQSGGEHLFQYKMD